MPLDRHGPRGTAKRLPLRGICMAARWLVMLVLGLVLLPTAARSQAPLRIAYTEFAPFHSRPSGEALEGFFHAIVTEALEKRLGVPLVWSAYPWKRCQQHVRSGRDDALLTVPTADRLTYTDSHPTPFYCKRMHVFTRADHPRLAVLGQLKNMADVHRHSLVVLTYRGNSWHDTYVATKGVKSYATDAVANVWRMLAAGRGDLVIEWPPGAWPTIGQLALQDRIVDTGVPLGAMSFHLLIRKGSAHVALLPAFERVIGEMRADGRMAAILEPFGGG